MLVPFQTAALRLAWNKCKRVDSHPAPVAAVVSADASSSNAAASWSAVVAKLKAQFKSDYPSEIITSENMPSLRLLSLVHHQHAKQDHKWVPWKFRLSQARAEDISASKSGRIHKAESLNLHSMILDDPPTLEIANGGLGLHALRGLFETYSIAMAMVGVCHLAAVKDYYTRFLSFMTHRLDSEAGLRNPSILEAQAADKHMMGVVCELVSERGWTWEDAFQIRYDFIFTGSTQDCPGSAWQRGCPGSIAPRSVWGERERHKGGQREIQGRQIPTGSMGQ